MTTCNYCGVHAETEEELKHGSNCRLNKRTLSDEINEFKIKDNICEDSLSVSNVKEKIQNVHKKLKELVKLQYQADEIDKIFKEEFGDKLLGEKQ